MGQVFYVETNDGKIYLVKERLRKTQTSSKGRPDPVRVFEVRYLVTEKLVGVAFATSDSNVFNLRFENLDKLVQARRVRNSN
jgi:hypothetical protein